MPTWAAINRPAQEYARQEQPQQPPTDHQTSGTSLKSTNTGARAESGSHSTPKTRKTKHKSKPSTPDPPAQFPTPESETLPSLDLILGGKSKGTKKAKDVASPSHMSAPQRAPLGEKEVNIETISQTVISEKPSKKSQKSPHKTPKRRSKTLDGSITRPMMTAEPTAPEKNSRECRQQPHPGNPNARQVLYPRAVKILPSTEDGDKALGKSTGRQRSKTTTEVDQGQSHRDGDQLFAAQPDHYSPHNSLSATTKDPKPNHSNFELVSLHSSPTPEAYPHLLEVSPSLGSPSPSRQLQPSVEDVYGPDHISLTCSSDASEEPDIKEEISDMNIIINRLASQVPEPERPKYYQAALNDDDLVELRASWLYDDMGQEMDEGTSQLLDAVNQEARNKCAKILRRHSVFTKVLMVRKKGAAQMEAQPMFVNRSQSTANIVQGRTLLAHESTDEGKSVNYHEQQGTKPDSSTAKQGNRPYPSTGVGQSSQAPHDQFPPRKPIQIAPPTKKRHRSRHRSLNPATKDAEPSERTQEDGVNESSTATKPSKYEFERPSKKPRSKIVATEGKEVGKTHEGRVEQSREMSESLSSQTQQRALGGTTPAQGLDDVGPKASGVAEGNQPKATQDSQRSPKTPKRAKSLNGTKTPRSAKGLQSGDRWWRIKRRSAQVDAQVQETVHGHGKALVVAMEKTGKGSTQPGVEVRVPMISKTDSRSGNNASAGLAPSSAPQPDTVPESELALMIRKEKEASRRPPRPQAPCTRTFEDLVRSQVDPLLPPCTCQSLPESFREDTDWAPSRPQFRGGGLEYFAHCSQISNCAGHPDHVRAFCRRAWFSESRGPNTCCDVREEPLPIRTNDAMCAEVDLADQTSSDGDTGLSGSQHTPQNCSQIKAAAPSKKSTEALTITNFAGQLTPSPSSPPEFEKKSKHSKQRKAVATADTTLLPDQSDPALTSSPIISRPKSKTKQRKSSDQSEAHDLSDAIPPSSSLTSKKRKRRHSKSSDERAETERKPASEPRERANITTPSTIRSCRAAKDCHGKCADDATCSPYHEQSSSSHGKSRKRQRSKSLQRPAIDDSGHHEPHNSPAHDDFWMPQPDDDDNYSGTGEPTADLLLPAHAPANASAQPTAQGTGNATSTISSTAFVPNSRARHMSMPPPRIGIRDAPTKTQPSLPSQLDPTFLLERRMRSQMADWANHVADIVTQRLPQTMPPPSANLMQYEVSRTRIGNAAAASITPQTPSPNPLDNPELSRIAYPQHLRASDNQLIQIAKNKRFGKGRRNSTAPYAFNTQGYFRDEYEYLFKTGGFSQAEAKRLFR